MFVKRLRLPKQTAKIIVIGLLLICIELIFFHHAGEIALRNIHSAEWDQAAYLKLSLQIAHRLSLTDGNRNPLYPLLLAPFAQQDIAFFSTAKIISLLIGGIGLLVIYGIAWQIVGPLGALIVTGLVASNPHYHYYAGFVDAEVLLTPLFFAAWYLTGKTIQSITQNSAHPQLKLAFTAGLVVGLVYLTKGTGSLLTIAFIITLFLLNGPRCFKHKTLWLFIGSFALVSVPLWLFNWQHYGNPLYNINTTHILWLDDWSQRYLYSDSNLPTALDYLSKHDVSDIISRLRAGLLNTPHQWGQAVWPTFATAHQGWSQLSFVLFGLLLFLGIASQTLSWRRTSRHSWFLYTLLASGSFWLLFGWYQPVSNDARFVFPWVAVLYVAPLWLFQEFRPALKNHDASLTKLPLIGYAILAIILGGYLLSNNFALPNISTMWKRDQEASVEHIPFMEEIIKKTEPGAYYLLGPTHQQTEWIAYDRPNLRIPKTRQDWYSFSTWLAEHDVQYAVLDLSTWTRRKSLLSRYWKVVEDGKLALNYEAGPPGWSLLKPDAYPCATCLFSIDQHVLEPPQNLDLHYANTIQLFGYKITPTVPSVNAPWTLTLYWRLLTVTQKDIHSFVHLFAEEEFIAQHDGSLVAGPFPGTQGRLPEYDLQPGTIIVEPHPMPSLPSGDYTLYIGLYDFETQVRLTAVPFSMLGTTVETPTSYPQVLTITVPASD